MLMSSLTWKESLGASFLPATVTHLAHPTGTAKVCSPVAALGNSFL